MSIKCIVAGLFLLIAPIVCAQSLDSLYKTFAETKGKNRIYAGQELARWIDKEGYVVDSCLFDERLPEKEFDLKTTSLATRYLFRLEYYPLAFEAACELKRLSELSGDTTSLIEGYYFMGFANQRMGKMDEGLLYAQQCYELALAYNDEEMLSSVLNNMGNIYMVNKQDSMAVVYFLQSLDIERKLGRKQNQAIRLGNLSSAYLKQEKTEEALAAAMEGLEIDRQNGRPDKLAIRYHQAGEVYIAMDNYSKAKEYELEALRYFRESGSAYGQSVILNSLGELEVKSGNSTAAVSYFGQALLFAESLGNNLLIQKIYYNLYCLHKNNNPALSLSYFEKYSVLKDSVFHADNRKQLNEFQVRYDTQQKELEIAGQRTEINRHKHNRTMLITGLVFSLTVLGFLGIILRQRNKRNNELVEINATKDKLFSIISHDLKNPAIAQRNAISELSRLPEEKTNGNTRKQYYNELLKSADGQVELLYNLLNWAQVQTGRMPYNASVFDFVSLLKEEAAAIQAMIRRKEIELNHHLPDEALVYGDRNMYAIVLRNLLANAVKFTHRGGKISLGITPVQGCYVVSVSDTGVGISAEHLSKLFRIGQLHPTSGTTGEQGSGLGLILCKELLEKQGSKLEVESAEGKGSCFRFSTVRHQKRAAPSRDNPLYL